MSLFRIGKMRASSFQLWVTIEKELFGSTVYLLPLPHTDPPIPLLEDTLPCLRRQSRNAS